MSLRALVCVVVMTLVFAAGCGNEPDFAPARQVIYLDHGDKWDARTRALFYYTPQGTMLHELRYSWFEHLEVSDGQRLADPTYLSRFGFLYSPEQYDPNFDGGPLNPGNFPVGFAQHRDEITGDAMLDITCAACHTGQLEYEGLSLRVDGGQPMHALAWIEPGQFLLQLIGALASTYVDPLKFDRFAQNVLGTRYPDGKKELREQLQRSLAGYNTEAASTFSFEHGIMYKDPGYGRLDALGRIADTVFGSDIDHRNEQIADAPVSYPHLWDIWKFDWVQWNGSVAQPMGRNIGEALGVKARLELLDAKGNALPPDELFGSAVLVREQHCVETALWQLGPPRWPDEIFPPIDDERVARGKALFEQNCRGCHGPHVYADTPTEPVREPVRYDCTAHPDEAKPTPDKPVEWKVCVVPAWDIGTDPHVVDNYLGQRYDASALDPGDPQLRSVSAAQGLDLLMNKVSERKFEELDISEEERWKMKGWGRENALRDMRGYKSRPLHGIWATPPFLHNGSVRTIYQLLSPHAERESKIWLGSREFDPVHVGYLSEETDWAYELDTSEIGNHNTGHQFTNAGGVGVIGPELTHEERLDLIEYLKALGNPKHDPDYEEYAKPDPGGLQCETDLQGPSAHPELRWPNV